MSYTYATISSNIKSYTEVDANVFTQAVLDDFIMLAENRINVDVPMDADRFVQEGQFLQIIIQLIIQQVLYLLEVLKYLTQQQTLLVMVVG